MVRPPALEPVPAVAAEPGYFFDPGVVRGVTRRLRSALTPDERGKLLETLVLHELRARIDIANLGGELCYWGTPSASEVDFIWTRGGRAVAIEVKASTVWRREFRRSLFTLAEAKVVRRCFAVYRGRERLEDGPITVLPLIEFMQELAEGRIIG